MAMMQELAIRQDPLEGLERFGYTAREAAFLRLAGLHSGYFLRRQYAEFLGKPVSASAAALIEKLVDNQHVKAFTYVSHTHIYHLCSRPFYAALGLADSRNRRERRPLTIKAKLMTLDFVLGHPQFRYLTKDAEKIEYFTKTLQLDPALLPARRYSAADGGRSTDRYFVDKHPIGLAASPENGVNEVVFCYVDAGATTISGFETYLNQYRDLLGALAQFRVLYVAARPLLFEQVERAFRRFSSENVLVSRTRTPDPPSDLHEYFQARWLYDRGELGSFDRAKLLHLREQRMRFSGPEIDSAFECWKHTRASDKAPISRPEVASARAHRGSLSTCLLEHRYDVFGTLSSY